MQPKNCKRQPKQVKYRDTLYSYYKFADEVSHVLKMVIIDMIPKTARAIVTPSVNLYVKTYDSLINLRAISLLLMVSVYLLNVYIVVGWYLFLLSSGF